MIHHPNQQKATPWNNVARAVVSKGFFRVADNVIYKGRKKDGKRLKMKVTFKDGSSCSRHIEPQTSGPAGIIRCVFALEANSKTYPANTRPQFTPREE